MCSPNKAFEEALNHFRQCKLAPEQMAMASGGQLKQEQGLIELIYFGQPYTISLTDGLITCPGVQQISYNDQIIILQYLMSASGLPPRGRWLSFLELPEGILHHAPFQTAALIPLAEAFLAKTDLLNVASKDLGGAALDMGDAASQVLALPKLPLAAVLWDGDEEFPPSSQILFDDVATTHLTTATLWVLGCEFADRLIARVKE